MQRRYINKTKNRLASFRRERGYSQRRVARLLGHRSHGALSSYERGRVMPTLTMALKLEIILRTPVAFLFPDIYDRLRAGIRREETRLAGSRWPDLLDDSPTPL